MEAITTAGFIGAAIYVGHLIKKKLRRKPSRTSSFRRRLIKVYGHRCMVCGYKKSVHAHHVIPRSEGGSDKTKNGVLLCPNCHVEAHEGRISRSKLRRYKKKAKRTGRYRKAIFGSGTTAVLL